MAEMPRLASRDINVTSFAIRVFSSARTVRFRNNPPASKRRNLNRQIPLRTRSLNQANSRNNPQVKTLVLVINVRLLYEEGVSTERDIVIILSLIIIADGGEGSKGARQAARRRVGVADSFQRSRERLARRSRGLEVLANLQRRRVLPQAGKNDAGLLVRVVTNRLTRCLAHSKGIPSRPKFSARRTKSAKDKIHL